MQSANNLDILRKLFKAFRDTPESVYVPSEDSFLMLDAISALRVEGSEVLDMGTGTGILGLFSAIRGARVTLTDIDESALEHAKRAAGLLGLHVGTILSDMFANVEGKFDFIFFNPPYLPSATSDDRTVDGGQRGTELSREFLAGLSTHLKPDGTGLLLVSSLNNPQSLTKEYQEFKYAVMAKRPLFFEELQVLSVGLREDLACQ